MKKNLILLVASSMMVTALVACNQPSKPYDPDENPGGGGEVKKKDFAYAINYDYQSFAIAYDQVYSDGAFEEIAYEYHRGGKYGVTVVDDYTYDQSIGSVEYAFYASTEDDDYAFWTKERGYEYDGWIANGYRDADLAMYHAYFNFYYLLDNITADDVENIAGLFYVKETSMEKLNNTAFQFYGNPFVGSSELRNIAFLLDSETGLISKIYGSVSENSDDGVEIQLHYINSASYPTGLEVPSAPYYNSDEDRNIYTYPEMLGDEYVPDVWPTSVSLSINDEVKTETGFDMVIDIAESIDISYDLLPENVNRKEYRWVVSNPDVIDLNYKNNFTSQHKYVTGIKEGTAELYIEFLKADGTYTKSNVIKVKVKGLPEIDKTNAVYDLDVVGGGYRTSEAIDPTTQEETEVVDKDYTDVLLNNASTLIPGAEYKVEGHNIHLLEAKNTDAFGDTGMVLYASPSSQDYMNSEVGFNSYLLFDFGDQEVVSLDFYYALQKASQKGAATSTLSEAYISTSIDGETWSEPIDMATEMKSNFENINLDYDAHIKIMSRSFEKARMVKLFFKANMVGKNFNICMDSFVFKNDETCHNHEQGGDIIEVESVTIASSSASVKVNKQLTFSISSIIPTNATNKNVTWHVSNDEYAEIDSNGVLTAKKEGTVKVYALSSNNIKSNEIEVTITGQEYLDEKWVGIKYLASDVVSNLTLYSLEFEILSTSTAKFTITPKGGDATVISLTYDTYDEDHICPYVFLGDNSEVLNAKLSAYDDSTCEVFLKGSVISLGNTHTNQGEELLKYVKATSIVAKSSGNVLADSFEMLSGKTMNVVTNVNPNSAYNKVCTAVSSDSTILKVENEMIDDEPLDNVFTLTSLSAGTATVTFSNGEVSKTYTVTIKESIKATSLTLTASKNQIEVDETLQFSTTINPNNANDYKLSYSVDNASYASINSSTGLLTAKKVGNVVVTVRDSVSGLESTFNLTISASSSKVSPAYTGEWSGEDIAGSTFTFTVNSNGTATLYSDMLADELSFTLEEEKSSSSSYYFLCDDGSGLEVVLYGTGTEKTFEVEVESDSLEGLYLYGPTYVTKGN